MPHLTDILRLPLTTVTDRGQTGASDKGFTTFCRMGGGLGLAACIAAFVSGASITGPLGGIALFLAGLVCLPFGLTMGFSLRTMTLIGLLYTQGLLLYGAFVFGGFASPTMPWFAAVPIFAYYYLRGGARFAVLTALALSLVVIAVGPLLGFDMSSSIPPERYNMAYFTSALLALMYVAYVARIFARLSNISFRKLSETKRASEERQRQAEWANAAKTQFLANMSHELRTPLNAIIGFSDIVRHQALGPVGNPKYAEYNQDIHDSALHLLAVINDILDYARIDAGKVDIEEARIQMNDLIDRVFKQIRFRPEAQGILLEKTVNDGVPDLYGDERLVTQVLINLMVNALKFTNDGGRVSLKAKTSEAGEVIVTVADTGIGIPEDDLKVIGKPFVKSQFTRRKSDDGFGLGLAISREFMTLHGGTIKFESTVGQGTTVTCTFPASRTLEAANAFGARKSFA